MCADIEINYSCCRDKLHPQKQHVSRDDTPTNFPFTVYSEPWPDAAVPIALSMNNLVVSGPARSIRVADLDFEAIDVIINYRKPK